MDSRALDWFFLMAMNSSSFFSNAALNLLSYLSKLQLGSKNLVLFLLKSGLSLLKSSLELKLLSFKTFANFVNLMNRSSSFSNLVHNILDFIRKCFVFSANLIQLEHRLFICILHLKQVRGSIASFLLAAVKIIGK